MEFFYTDPSLRKTCPSQQIFKEIFSSFMSRWGMQWVSMPTPQPHRDFTLTRMLKRRGPNCCCHGNWASLYSVGCPRFWSGINTPARCNMESLLSFCSGSNQMDPLTTAICWQPSWAISYLEIKSCVNCSSFLQGMD